MKECLKVNFQSRWLLHLGVVKMVIMVIAEEEALVTTNYYHICNQHVPVLHVLMCLDIQLFQYICK